MRSLYYLFYLIKGGGRKIAHYITDLACKNDVIFKKGVRFTMTAKVENISKNRDNIIIGENTIIEGKLLVFKYGGKIKIGENVYVGLGSNIWSGELIEIGNNVLISHNVNIIDTNSHEIDYEERLTSYSKQIKFGHPISKGNVETGKIIIGDNVWISFNSVILKNIKIGKGAIIAAGSVVTKDVAPFTLVAGNPARIIKTI